VKRTVAWAKDAPYGVEHAEITFVGDTIHARSVAIGTHPEPYRVDVELSTGHVWITTSLAVRSRGNGWDKTLRLDRSPSGIWSLQRNSAETFLGPHEQPSDVAIPPEVVDIDLQYSPLTNLMPARRLGLANVGATADFTMAWVSLPDLGVILDRQRYTIVEQHAADTTVRYASLDSAFTANITCDPDGLAIDYPGIARRLGP
jgi:uncharacterized protein